MCADIVTRFAPSPTGELHLGNARTALFNWLLAHHGAGRMILRIEDTDAGRSDAAKTEALQADLEWLGLHWEEGPKIGGPAGPYLQSARQKIYDPYFAALETAGLAYPCFCTALELELSRRAQLASGRPPRYAGTCRELTEAQRADRRASGLKAALRFRVLAGQRIEFSDLVHGLQSTASEEIGDFIIRREDGTAAFFFSNAVDDALMAVTHVLRGDDHLANTPRQLLLLQALALPMPQYGHLALLTGADGAPLSKRNGALSVRELRERGYAGLALCNLLFRLGHSTGRNELLMLAGMAANFDITHLQRASAHLDPGQLRHWQGEWARSLGAAEAVQWLEPWLPADLTASQRAALVEAVRPNIVAGAEIKEWLPVFFGEHVACEPQALEAVKRAGAAFFVAAAGSVAERADLAVMREATGKRGAEFFMPVRAALTGRLHGPELAPLLKALGAARVRERLLAVSRSL